MNPLPFIEWRFYQGSDWIAKLIQWRAAGTPRYCHVDVLGPDNNLWGAHSDWIKPDGWRQAIPPGFQRRPSYYKEYARTTAYRLTVTPLQYQRFWDFSEQQIGKPYDKRGLIDTFILGRDWRDPTAWWCSEEQMAACEYAAIVPRSILVSVDPGDFALALNVRGAAHFDIPSRSPHSMAA